MKLTIGFGVLARVLMGLLAGCATEMATDELAEIQQGVGTCSAGLLSVSLDKPEFQGQLNTALHTNNGLGGQPGCVYVPIGRWPQNAPIYVRSGQKILGAGPSSVVVAPVTEGYFISNVLDAAALRSSDDFVLRAADAPGNSRCETQLEPPAGTYQPIGWFARSGRVQADNVELGHFRLEAPQLDIAGKLSKTNAGYPFSCHTCVQKKADGACAIDDDDACIFHRAITFAGWHETNSKAGQRYRVRGLSIHDVEIHAVSGITLAYTEGATLAANRIFGIHDTSQERLDHWAQYNGSGAGNFSLALGIGLSRENIGATITGNHVEGVTAEGISIDLGAADTCSTGYLTTGTLVEGNTVVDTGRIGLLVFGGHSNTFRNNTVMNAGMWQRRFEEATAIHGGSFNRFEGNTVTGCGFLHQINRWIDEEIAVPTSGNVLANNIFVLDRPDGGCRTGYSSTFMGAGILAAGDSQTMIEGNVLRAPRNDAGEWPAILVTDGVGATVRNNRIEGFHGRSSDWPGITLAGPRNAAQVMYGTGAYTPEARGARHVSVTQNCCATGNGAVDGDGCPSGYDPCDEYTCGDACVATSTPIMFPLDGVCNGGETTTSCPADCGCAATSFDATRATGRTVAGDFNGDGTDEIGAIVDNGGSCTQLVVFDRKGRRRVWADLGCGNFAPVLVTGRVVAGDFDGNGLDDIAAFYDYGNAETRAHLFLSTGSAFAWSIGWWNTGPGNFWAGLTTDRVVAADFDGNGKDDVALFYDYGSTARMHVLLSTGSAFQWNGTASPWDPGVGAFEAFRCNGRFVAGDFSGDGKPDIACLYDAESVTRFFVWRNYGSGFWFEIWKQIAATDGFHPSMIQHLTVAGDFDNDGDDDIGTLYDYYGDRCEVAAHMFLSTRTGFGWVGRGRFDGVIQSIEASPGVFKDKWVGSWIYEGWWDGMWRNWWYAKWIEDQPASVDRGKYCPDKARRRMIAGDLDGNGIDDIGVLYDWGYGRGSVDSFLSIGNGFRLRSMFTTSCGEATICAP